MYAGPHIREDMKNQWKYEEAQIIKIALEGASLSKNYVYYILDVPRGREKAVFAYIEDNKLYSREPIRVPGKKFVETKLLVPKVRAHSIRKELLERGAEAIVSTPITSVTGLNSGNNHKQLLEPITTNLYRED